MTPPSVRAPSALLLGLALLASPVAAQQGPETGPSPEGIWRIDGRDDAGRPVGGRLRLHRAGGQLRYERRARAELGGRARVERGRALLRDGLLLTRSTPAPERFGVSQRLRGADPRTLEPRRPTVGRYRPAEEAGWRGSRARTRRSGSVAERLLPWDPERDGNRIRLLIEGEAFTAMERAIAEAERSIDVQTFQWADDATGRRIAEALMRKAREGVRVRCLVDDSSNLVNSMQSWHIPDDKVDLEGTVWRKGLPRGSRDPSLADELEAAGAEIIVQHGPLKGIGNSLVNAGRSIADGVRRLFGGDPPAREKRGLTNHDHRKVLIVDERIGFCGGMNIASEYEHEWHDIQARVEGPAAHALHEDFVDRWRAAGGEARVAPEPDVAWTGDVPVEVLGTVPGLDRSIREMYEREIQRADERILIEVAYFLDDRIIDLLGEAVDRGVDTKVILPADEVNNVVLVKEAFQWVRNDVIRSGVELYFYQPALSHGKVAAFDGERATVGSSNLDPMALDLVAEQNLYVPDARFARELEERVFAEDLPQCERGEVRSLPWYRKVTSGVLHFFRDFL